MVTEGMLLVMHPNNLLKLYSWEKIIEQNLQYDAPLYTPCRELDGGIVGSRSAGLPLNVIIREPPPVLFEVKCQDHNLVFGGIPWHYIMCPHGTRSQFNVYSVADNSLVQNGQLNMDSISVEPDKCFFHEDDSGRILHIGANEIRMLNLKQGDIGYCLKENFSIKAEQFTTKLEENQKKDVTITSSGRQVRRASTCVTSVDCDLETVQLVEYEDDLDLLTVTVAYQKEDWFAGTLYLHHNETGELLKEIPLQEPWAEFCSHNVILDLDKIIHIVERPNRKFDCYVYQLDLKPEEDDSGKRSVRKKRTRELPDRLGRAQFPRSTRTRTQRVNTYHESSDSDFE